MPWALAQQQRSVPPRPLRPGDPTDQVEKQALRALTCLRGGGGIALRHGEHQPVQVRPVAADADQRQQRGAQGIRGRAIAGHQLLQCVA